MPNPFLSEPLDGYEFLSRIFEPMSENWQTRFHIGDKVRTIRPHTFAMVPTGAAGEVTSIEIDGTSADKGRVLRIKFDMRPFNLKLSDTVPAETLQGWKQHDGTAINPDELITETSLNMTPMDIEIIQHGDGLCAADIQRELAREGSLLNDAIDEWLHTRDAEPHQFDDQSGLDDLDPNSLYLT